MFKVIKFYTNTCLPCKMMQPIFDKTKEKFEALNIEFMSLNAEDVDVQNQYDIKSVPTTIVFKDNVEVDRLLGASPLKAYSEFIERCVS